VACALLDRLPAGACITVLEPAPKLGAGVAYGECGPCHLLNVSEEKPRAFPDSPRSFLGWALRAKGGEADPFRQPDGAYYFPRMWLGEYVRDELAWRQRQRGADIHLEHIRSAVEQIAPNDGNTGLVLDDGRTLWFDAVVLAIGNAPPRPLACSHQTTRSAMRVVQNPWDLAGLGSLAQSSSRLIIVGTGLTMSDVVISLQQEGYRGDIVAISRHGYLPRLSRARMQSYVSDVFPACRSLTDVLHAIRGWCSESQRLYGDWRPGFEFARLSTGRIWRRLAERERQRLKGRLLAIWNMHRYPMPPSTYEVLHELLGNGGLTIKRGTFVEVTDGGVVIENGGVRSLIHGDAVINATGPDRSFSTWHGGLAGLLAQTGLDSELAARHGLAIDSRGRVLDEQGEEVRAFWALGSVARRLRGELTTATDIGSLAINVAEDVVGSLRALPGKCGRDKYIGEEIPRWREAAGQAGIEVVD
jgi:uncharacterized NAD(P)/FAD-binding protein YdhS